MKSMNQIKKKLKQKCLINSKTECRLKINNTKVIITETKKPHKTIHFLQIQLNKNKNKNKIY